MMTAGDWVRVSTQMVELVRFIFFFPLPFCEAPMAEKLDNAATAEQFADAAEHEREKRAVPVRLPSGLVARLVKPTPLEILLRTGRVPQSFAARINPAEKGPLMTAGDWVRVSTQMVELVRFIFFFPRVPDECAPGTGIPTSDVEWAVKWGNGEVTEAQPAPPDLAAFPQAVSPGGSGGEALQPAPGRSPEWLPEKISG